MRFSLLWRPSRGVSRSFSSKTPLETSFSLLKASPKRKPVPNKEDDRKAKGEDLHLLQRLMLAYLAPLHHVHQALQRCVLFDRPLKSGAFRLEEALKAGEHLCIQSKAEDRLA